jgi:hypothetical protein
MVQFMAIFSGMKVAIGQNDAGSDTNLVEVPVIYGSRDRVVSHILSENTQNKMLRLPMISSNVIGLELATDFLSGQNQERKEVKLKRGGSIPDDLQQLTMLKPVPYRVFVDLGINVSNTDQHFQILEQILLLFNPSLQIQMSDVYGNMADVIEVFFRSLAIDEDYPAGAERRIISSSLAFDFVMYLSSPVNLRDEIIKTIKLRISASNDVNVVPSELNANVDPFIITAEDWDQT